MTSIQHGGSVTLVSLNGDSMNQKDSEIKHVHHHHFVPPFLDSSSGIQGSTGSQTLPRKGSKKISLKPSASDDSEVVIKKQGVNGVKIQLNLNQLENEDELSEKRRLTLEELEVEGFSTSSKNSDFDEEVDLNSLIEGDVDEIDEDSQTLGKLTTIFWFPVFVLFLYLEENSGISWQALKKLRCSLAPKKVPMKYNCKIVDLSDILINFVL